MSAKQTKCPECKVDHKDLPGYELFEFAAASSICPSCGSFVGAPDVLKTYEEVIGTARPFSESRDAASAHTEGHGEPSEHKSMPNRYEVSETSGRRTSGDGRSKTSPFRLSVKKVPVSINASSVCLEIMLTNLADDVMRGHLWLSTLDGQDGRSLSFTLQPSGVTESGDELYEQIHPQIRFDSSSSGHVAVRLRLNDGGAGFWQGDLLLRRENNGGVRVGLNIDKSIHAENYLEGIRNGHSADTININAFQPYSDQWNEVRVRYRGLKELADPSDAFRPKHNGRRRSVQHQEKGPILTTQVHTSRLTLSTSQTDGREAYVQLIAGKTLHLGRARTWEKYTHPDEIPNDIALRTLASDENDNFISRYHGIIRHHDGDVTYENLSDMGTAIQGRSLRARSEKIPLRNNVRICPGRDALTNLPNKDQGLGLQVRRTSCPVTTELYDLLVQDSHLVSGFDADHCHDVITLQRTDAVGSLEHYVFFPHATLLGRNESMCGWRIDDSSVEPIHAIVLWFDESFWIEPYSASSVVKVHGSTIPLNCVRRLKPGAILEIGAKQFIVLPEWKQHLIDCPCCPPHGYQNGCRCKPCIDEHNRRTKELAQRS